MSEYTVDDYDPDYEARQADVFGVHEVHCPRCNRLAQYEEDRTDEGVLSNVWWNCKSCDYQFSLGQRPLESAEQKDD